MMDELQEKVYQEHISEMQERRALQEQDIASAIEHREEMARIAEANLKEYEQSNALTREFREKHLTYCEREAAALERIANVLEGLSTGKILIPPHEE